MEIQPPLATSKGPTRIVQGCQEQWRAGTCSFGYFIEFFSLPPFSTLVPSKPPILNRREGWERKGETLSLETTSW